MKNTNTNKKTRTFKVIVERHPIYQPVGRYPSYIISEKTLTFSPFYKNVCNLNDTSVRFNQDKFLTAFKNNEVRDIIEFSNRKVRYQLQEIIKEF